MTTRVGDEARWGSQAESTCSQDGLDALLHPEDDVPFGDRFELGQGNNEVAELTHPEDDVPFDVRLGRRSGGDNHGGAAVGTHGVRDQTTHPPEPDAKRARTEVQHQQDNGAVDDAMGMITQVIPMSSAEARTQQAKEAVRRELTNVTGKGVFDPKAVCDWAEVRNTDPEAMIGSARMILGRKHA